MGKTTITALPADSLDNTPESQVDDEQVAGRFDFFFEGGDTLATWMEGTRPGDASQRLMNLTTLFEQPVILYKLPQGGIGLMNPNVMTRAVFKAGGIELPSGSWHVEPI